MVWLFRYVNEQSALKLKSETSRGVYVFSDLNPYVGHPNPLKEGQELFRKGLLSEAVLALEAEVLKNPDNAEGWRLLGITHAENDDDQQVLIVFNLHSTCPFHHINFKSCCIVVFCGSKSCYSFSFYLWYFIACIFLKVEDI